MTFDELDGNLRKTPEQRHDFWFKTKRLQHGTLVCLLQPGGGDGGADRLLFATICQRDVDRLAPRSPQPGFRPSIGLRRVWGWAVGAQLEWTSTGPVSVSLLPTLCCCHSHAAWALGPATQRTCARWWGC